MAISILCGYPKLFGRERFRIFSAEFDRIPNDVRPVTEEQRAVIEKLIEKLEEDEDVQNVYHNMADAEENMNNSCLKNIF